MSSNINSSHSFRKNKNAIQSVTPVDPSPKVSFQDFDKNMFAYLDDVPNICYQFVDDFTVKILRDGYYDIQAQVNVGNNTVNSYFIICIDTGAPIFTAPCICADGVTLIPFNNGLHTYNAAVNLSGKCYLSANTNIVIQYACNNNTDIYPSSFISIKFLNS